MRPQIAILAIALCDCVSQPHCVLLKFQSCPSDAISAKLAATQANTSPAEIAAWFKSGERTFLLASSHTNEIALATANGATAKGVK
jgi:hypothetical protein